MMIHVTSNALPAPDVIRDAAVPDAADAFYS